MYTSNIKIRHTMVSWIDCHICMYLVMPMPVNGCNLSTLLSNFLKMLTAYDKHIQTKARAISWGVIFSGPFVLLRKTT